MIWQGNTMKPHDDYELRVIETRYGVTWMVDNIRLGVHLEGYVLFIEDAMKAAQSAYCDLLTKIELGV